MLLGGPFCAQAQIAVTRNGKPQARIVVMRETPVNRTAAGAEIRCIKYITGEIVKRGFFWNSGYHRWAA